MVLINLVKNAREALRLRETIADGGSRITLRAGVDAKGKAFIEIEDNGPGIPSELLDEIFIPFFTTKPTGTGVGLSISKQIMQMHGGDVRVSTSMGGGARFVLEF
jgi:signal transduction histidine kinase